MMCDECLMVGSALCEEHSGLPKPCSKLAANAMYGRMALRNVGKARTEWTSYSIVGSEMQPGALWWYAVMPQLPFKIRWLIVTSPGFQIIQGHVGNMAFLGETATDLYLMSNWDKLAEIGQLDRVRIDAVTAVVGNMLSLEVRNNNRHPAKFEAGFIGEQLVDFESGIMHLPDAGPTIYTVAPAAPPPSAAPHVLGPLARSCPECGVAREVSCFGVKRGEFHKRREKVKHQ